MRMFALQQFWGVAKLVKAPDFDSGIRRFESFLLSQIASGRFADSAGLPELFSGRQVSSGRHFRGVLAA
jgi:hypothetical protein